MSLLVGSLTSTMSRSILRSLVDWVKLEIPSYPKIIKKPMDLATMKKKLDRGEYPNSTKFYDDFKLIIRNCFTFNPEGTLVNQAGVELQKVFDDKWTQLPPIREVSEGEDEDEEEEESEDEQSSTLPLGSFAMTNLNPSLL